MRMTKVGKVLATAAVSGALILGAVAPLSALAWGGGWGGGWGWDRCGWGGGWGW